MDRRKFIQLSSALTGITSLPACHTRKKITGSIVGANASVGHLLRDKQFASPVETTQKDVAIIGGGVSGLSAARYLKLHNVENFELLELDNAVGGNALSGQNSVSSFPWGAHYVPIPNNDLVEYLEFLQDCNVIVGRNEQGLPVYNETHLCLDPQERLYLNGRWQDGLVPKFGVPPNEVAQIELFLKKMDAFRYIKGSDGKDAFAIPVDFSSGDSAFVQLDQTSMKQWMLDNNFTSEHLHEYVNYCCRDDFGTPHHLASAWVGIHYFAARKGKGVNAEHDDVLTWPEGNGYLVNALRAGIEKNIRTHSLVTKVSIQDAMVHVEYLDTESKMLKAIEAKQCILAIPQFIASRLLHDDERINIVRKHLTYSPWMVANMKVNALQERSGAPASWDNVLHGGQSLGYVEATHQLLQQNVPQRNLTYYLPLTQKTPAEERKAALERTHEEWVKMIIDDLKVVHPNIEESLDEVNVMVWGHAMAQPVPNFIHGGIRKNLANSIKGKIHFAHTDLSGVSIFEEAFYQGLKAAKQTLLHLPIVTQT